MLNWIPFLTIVPIKILLGISLHKLETSILYDNTDSTIFLRIVMYLANPLKNLNFYKDSMKNLD